MRNALRCRLVAAAVLAAAAPALAQDYVVSSVSGQYVTPPTSGTNNLVFSSKQRDDNTYAVSNLPFQIFYFGEYYSSMQVCTNGFVQFGGGNSVSATPTAFPLSGGLDGICAAAWDDLDGLGQSAALVVFTDGTAPDRRIIVDWSGWEQAPTTGSLAFQVQFFETSGRIQMAYASGWSGQTRAKAVGIDAVSPDTRYVTPDGSTLYYTTPTSQPGNDWRFDPRITTFSGRLLYDRYVVDATGIGNTSQQNVALAGLRVEVRDAAARAVASGTTDANGDFSLEGRALPGTASGTIHVLSEGSACAVRSTSGGAPYAVAVASSVSFGSNQALGTLSLTEGNDAGGTLRAPLNVARAIQGAYAWSAARTSATIPPLEVLCSTGSQAQTSYTPAASTAASMRVAAAGANPDAWDDPVVRRTYARHVLAAIAASPTTAMDATFDKTTDAENAFAEGFGHYLNAAVSGTATFMDGVSSSSATQIDLESPTILAPKGPAVAGWVAAALYDLVDGANESWDTFDGGNGALDKVLQTVDSLTSPVTADSFYEAWGQLGFAGDALARDFIRHGLLGDDADEPNDSSTERKNLTQWGFARTGRVLNLYNEDWYDVTLPADTDEMTVDVVYDRGAISAVVSLEVRSSAGALLGSGSYLPLGGPLRAALGAQPAGTYRVRVKHESGDRVDAYALQCFSKLTIAAESFRPWTVNRPYDVPVDAQGGVKPYTLTVEQPFVAPPGLILDGPNSRVRGAPSEAGTYEFSLTVRDAATPNNLASVSQHFVVHPELTFSFGEFFAVPLGRALDRPGAYAGGTAPFTFATTQGALPDGIGFAPGEFRFVGTPTTAGSTRFTLEGTDVAGSSATSETTGVVCGPFGDATLAAGGSACGFWFDAVYGTTVSVAVKTAKKQTKRALRIAILAPDGSTAVPVAVKTRPGKASVLPFVAPATGRFYCVVASDDTLGASVLTGAVGLKLPKKGKGDSGDQPFPPGSDLTVEVGAVAGASLTLSAKPAKGSSVVVRYPYLVAPDGTVTPLTSADVIESKGGVTFTRTLPASGTWQVVLGLKPGPAGSFTYTYKIQQPKGVPYSED
jgi:putative Ig domain-containing protein